MQNIIFKKLSPDDLYHLHLWLQEVHVREFWEDGDRTIEQVNSHYFCNDGTQRYMFLINGELAGYIQSYIIDSENEYIEFVAKNQVNMGIDFFIGNTRYLGKGLAKAILEKFVELYEAGEFFRPFFS